MAFERPVEADRVDDLGLLSSIVRGPIMWMLGGDRDKQADKPADATLMLPPRPPMRAIREAAEEGEGTVSPGTVEGAPSPAVNKGGKSPMPAAVLCDAGSSEEEEEGEPSHDNSNANAASPLDGTHSQSLPDISSRDALPGPSRIARSQSARGPADAASSLGGRRRTSWSDESGSPLVEYSYFYHNDKAASNASNPNLSAVPKKSAMKNSEQYLLSSMTSSSAGVPVHGAPPRGSSRLSPSKCVPSGLKGKGGGVIMPSGGGMAMPSFSPCPSSSLVGCGPSSTAHGRESTSLGGTGSSGGGIASAAAMGTISPQWGWYISTTPPTPDKYYAASSKQQKPKEDIPAVPETMPADHPAPVFHRSEPSPKVFKKGGVPSPSPLSWPSVPL